MKKLLTCLLVGLCFYCTSIYSQSEQLEDKVLTALSTLNQAQCPSGRLYERVPEYYPLAYWRGNYLSDSTAFLISRFSAIHGMLHKMEVSQNSSLPTMNQVILDAQEMKYSDTLRLGILLNHYDRFRADAITSNLITYQNDHFYDVAGRTESPYQSDTVFAFSTFHHLKHQLTQKFLLPTKYLNSSIPYSSFEIDFDDGVGYRTINVNELSTITYPDYDTYKIKCRMIDESGRVYVAQSILELTPTTGGVNYNVDADDSVSLQGVRVFWWYNKNCDDKKIRKPLILVEGFNPLNQNGPSLVFDKYAGDAGLLDRTYDDPNDKLLSEYLHDDDYDVFYIDYKSGGIDISENSLYVHKAIQWINDRKHKDGSYEKNVVIGASMGGVVGRYALKIFENSGRDHETEFFLSVDSPLKGANIPIGMQVFVQELGEYKLAGVELKDFGSPDVFAEDGNGLRKGWYNLNSPAAKQMLYLHYDSPSWSDCGFLDGDCKEVNADDLGAVHDDFYAEFESLGPLNIPHYGISNGSILRKEQQFSAGASLADAFLTTDELLDQAGFNDFWSDATELLVAAITASGFFSEHKINALNGDGRHRVYYGGFGTVVLGIPFIKITKRFVIDSKPFDNAPGGMRIFEKGLKWNFESFCFIPTISSLMLNTTDPMYAGISTLVNVEQTVNNGTTQLSYYSGSVEEKPFFGNGTLFWNEDHVSLNKRLAEYLRNVSDYSTITVANPLTNSTFNFGTRIPTLEDIKLNRKPRIRNVINYDLDIISDGNLWVNKLNRIGYINNPNNPMNQYSKSYDLNIIQDCIDTTLITVKDGGTILVGDEANNRKGTLQLNDSTRLVVKNFGLVKVESKSILNINSGAILTVTKDGKLQAGFDSKIVVRSGGVLRIDGKGILYLTDNAEVIVELGGKIIVENGAILRLQDGDLDNNGKCRILIKENGIFRYEGPWKHEGNGHIQFDQQSVFSVDPSKDVVMTGYKKNLTFLRLNVNNKLDIACQLLNINRGTIDYEPRTQIKLFGGLNLDSMVCQGTKNYIPQYVESLGFYMEGYNNTYNLFLADFRNMLGGITGTGAFKMMNTLTQIKRTTFNTVYYPFQLIDCKEVKVDSVFAIVGSSSKVINSELVSMNRFNVNNFHVGIEVYNNFFGRKSYAVFRKSNFTNCEYGIYGTQQANVFAYESSFINNTEMGIYMLGDANYGVVEAGCCTFINNNICIGGTDPLLSISPLATGSGYGAPGNNKFLLVNTMNNYFDIYYAQRDIQVVNAEYNYWGGEAPNPNNWYIIKGSDLVPVIYTPYHTLAYHTCPTQGSNGFNNLCPTTVRVDGATFTNVRINANSDFHDGNIEGAEVKMNLISDQQGNDYYTSTGACRFHFDYARAFTGVPLSGGQPIVTSTSTQEVQKIFIQPNPVNDQFTIRSEESIKSVKIYNSLGIEIHQSNALDTKNYNLNTSQWQIGVYTARVELASGKVSVIKGIAKY
ncbi:MAG: T9SS type A sorting domain-containing protein [Saprospiraceae bacterium]|nr:T9SS type A sorting domain-containing protein [Saprospiraceae bacterium]